MLIGDSEDPHSESAVELYVRSLAPVSCRTQASVIEQLSRLESEDKIQNYSVEVWGTYIPAEKIQDTEVGQYIRDRINRFRRWAEDRNRSLKPFFSTETIASELTGEEFTCIRLPMMALAEYETGTLRCISPYSEGDSTYTIADHLVDLETVKSIHRVPQDATEKLE